MIFDDKEKYNSLIKNIDYLKNMIESQFLQNQKSKI